MLFLTSYGGLSGFPSLAKRVRPCTTARTARNSNADNLKLMFRFADEAKMLLQEPEEMLWGDQGSWRKLPKCLLIARDLAVPQVATLVRKFASLHLCADLSQSNDP